MIVADQGGIKVRTPFDIPTFLGSDSLPNDDFQSELNTVNWLNASDYETFVGSLQLVTNALSGDGGGEVAESRFLTWFKDSVLASYQIEIQYDMVAGGDGQVVAVVIKREASSFLIAQVYLKDGDYSVSLQFSNNGVRTTLESSTLGGANLAEGFLRISYNATTRTATCRVIPSGGNQVTLSSQLNELQDSALGQGSAIGISRESEAQVQIDQVTGGGI